MSFLWNDSAGILRKLGQKIFIFPPVFPGSPISHMVAFTTQSRLTYTAISRIVTMRVLYDRQEDKAETANYTFKFCHFFSLWHRESKLPKLNGLDARVTMSKTFLKNLFKF